MAVHEIGHVLGFNHSSEQNSVMNANYLRNIRSGFELTDDDIEKVTGLYGK